MWSEIAAVAKVCIEHGRPFLHYAMPIYAGGILIRAQWGRHTWYRTLKEARCVWLSQNTRSNNLHKSELEILFVDKYGFTCFCNVSLRFVEAVTEIDV